MIKLKELMYRMNEFDREEQGSEYDSSKKPLHQFYDWLKEKQLEEVKCLRGPTKDD